MPIFRLIISISLFLSFQVKAQKPFLQCEKIIFGCYSENIESFKAFALRAKECGATHIAVHAEDLPLAYWELKPEYDPYPAWVITNPGLLKINPPARLQPYIPEEYGKSVMSIMEQRCKVLRQMDMKASFHTFEPQMLPEEFFIDHPSLRGPQVDNPRRSRVERFAPSMSHPEVLTLYSEALDLLKQKCPEIDILEFRTNDSGAGIEWSDALYPGPNGNSRFRSQKMSARIHDFLNTLQGQKEDSRHIPDVHVYNSKEIQKEDIAHHLDMGQALDNMEGPDATPFKSEIGSLLYYRRPFAPVPGIPCPVTFLQELEEAAAEKTKRLFILMGDRHNTDLYFNIYTGFLNNPTHSDEDRLRLLRKIAVIEVGEKASGHLVDAWLALNKAEEFSGLLSSGGSIFILGCVHQRWLVRPFVPFPSRLTEKEKEYYRPFQFQAGSEENANDLLNLQGTRFVDGYNGYRLANRTLSKISREIQTAKGHLRSMDPFIKNSTNEAYDVLDTRLKVFMCLIINTRNAMHYQVVLDRAIASNPAAVDSPPLPFVSPMDYGYRQELMKTAKNEMDNTIELIHLLNENNQVLILDHTENKDEEYHRLLGPDLIEQLNTKVSIMNKYWIDYEKISAN